MSESVLFIVYDFPPILSPESIQVNRRAAALAKDGIKVFILTSHQKPLFENLDDDFEIKNKNITLIRTKKPPCEKILNIIFKLADITDRKFWWQFFAFRLGVNLVKKYNIKTLYSHSTPLVDHLVALKIKKQYPDINWIAHFSDPWSLNPYIKYKTRWQKRLNQKLEAKVLQGANTISVTSLKTKQLFEDNFTNVNIKVLPHVFDSSLYGVKMIENRVVHTGNIYGLRTIKPFLYALKSSNIKKYEFYFFGRIKKDEEQLVKKLQLDNLVKIKEPIGYKQSLEEISKAEFLMVIDAPLENSPFFPSKLADYLGANRTIIALTTKNSTTVDILNFTNNSDFVANSNTQDEIEQLLHNLTTKKDKKYKNLDYFDYKKTSANIKNVFNIK